MFGARVQHRIVVVAGRDVIECDLLLRLFERRNEAPDVGDRMFESSSSPNTNIGAR
jgi:hypothetical protein